MTVNKTALYDCHVNLSAQIVEFASTLLPVRYKSEREEHLAVRNAVGMFDVSHMGEILVTGDNAHSFLQYIVTNDLEKLNNGDAHYSLLLNERGGIIDDLIVYRLAKNNYLLCVNAANVEKDFSHIAAYARDKSAVDVKNASAQFSQIAVQGPATRALLQALSGDPIPERFRIRRCNLAGIDTLVARTGYTGEDGVEIFVSPQRAEDLWNSLLVRGENFGLIPCGLAARDSLRLEAGMLLHGQDMDESTSPREAGLMFAVALTKENFVGKAALIAHSPQKKLIGFVMQERSSIPRHGFKVFDQEHQEIGVVSSGSLPPTHDSSAIGFAYVPLKSRIGEEVLIDIRGQFKRARLCKPRFLNHA